MAIVRSAISLSLPCTTPRPVPEPAPCYRPCRLPGRRSGPHLATPGVAKGQGGARRGDKTEAVKKALARGLTSPTEIGDHVRRKQGLEITPGHVTTIKGTLKRKGG